MVQPTSKRLVTEAVLDARLADATGGTTDPEVVRDTIAAALVAGANVTITPNDTGNTITIAAAGGTTDPEVVRDTIASALVAGAGVTITPNDGSDTITIAATSVGGGANADSVYTVAASNTSASLKTNADLVCDGTADHVEIQAAIDAVMQNPSGGGEVVLLAGTYNITSTISLGHPTDSVGSYRVHLRFERGAKVRWTTVTGTTPLIKIESSDCLVSNPWVEGSGSKGNGYGIVFGGDTTNFGGRWTKTVYRSSVSRPYATNLTAGVVFAVDRTGSSSSGDNSLWGGYISNCQDGILSAGFTNRVYGTTIATCNNCLHGTGDRQSHMIEVYGATFNQWSNACIWLEKDKGSLFESLWAEHTAAQSAVPTQAILLGATTSSTYVASNTRFTGNTSLHLEDETYLVRHVRSNNVTFENIILSTNGSLPTTALIRQDATHTGKDFYNRITFMTGTIPATWSYSLLRSIDASATGKVVVKVIPGLANAVANTTIGDGRPPTEHDYRVETDGTTYWARDRDGDITIASADTATVSGLRAVLVKIATHGKSIYFPPGTYEFIEDPAGDQDHWAPNGLTHMTLEGAGDSTIISNWRDDSQTGYDTLPDVEPFSFTRCHFLTYKNFRVWAGGNIDSNNSSDTLDFDGCANITVENILVERSRARAIAYDGGDDGAVAVGGTIRNCRIRGVPGRPALFPGSAGTMVTQQYRYVVSYVDSILGETPPSEYNSITPATTNKIKVQFSLGPSYKTTRGVTARKIYRWSAAQPTYRLVATINDNTTREYEDNATDASISAAATPNIDGVPLIPSEGIKILGANRVMVTGNVVESTRGHGIQSVRKGSDTASKASNYHKITNNTVRQAGAGALAGSVAGIYVGGSSYCVIANNTVVNAGTPTNLGLGIYLQGLGGELTEFNIVSANAVRDSNDANTPHGAKTTRYGLQLNVASGGNNPADTQIIGNTYSNMLTGDVNLAASTRARQYSFSDHTHTAGPGGIAPVTLNWRSGSYYGSRTVLAHSSTSAQALTADQVYASPFYVPQDITVTTIACNVSTAAGTKIRLGIYIGDANGKPSTLVTGSESGDLTTSTGLKTATISAFLLGGYWYFGAIICDGAVSVSGFSGGQQNILGSVDPGSGSKQSAFRYAPGSGWTSMPATYSSSPTATATTPNVEVTF